MRKYPRQIELFRRERLRVGLSGRELAEKMGVNPGFVSGCETGAKLASRRFCERYAEAVGLQPDHFWDLLHGATPRTAIAPRTRSIA